MKTMKRGGGAHRNVYMQIIKEKQTNQLKKERKEETNKKNPILVWD